jgi:hypothetical protein
METAVHPCSVSSDASTILTASLSTSSSSRKKCHHDDKQPRSRANHVDIHVFFRIMDARNWKQIGVFAKHRNRDQSPQENVETYLRDPGTIAKCSEVSQTIRKRAKFLLASQPYDGLVEAFSDEVLRVEQRGAEKSTKSLFLRIAQGARRDNTMPTKRKHEGVAGQSLNKKRGTSLGVCIASCYSVHITESMSLNRISSFFRLDPTPHIGLQLHFSLKRIDHLRRPGFKYKRRNLQVHFFPKRTSRHRWSGFNHRPETSSSRLPEVRQGVVSYPRAPETVSTRSIDRPGFPSGLQLQEHAIPPTPLSKSYTVGNMAIIKYRPRYRSHHQRC